ncbi:hypothetical protein R5R35_009694 [Gryllus longicercus]|uniref:CCHC-type domain-containing protein n=1 Tax=Gryllus longicercus TaxID=2509291 RepID=A0AAN9Z547_9ORTH
MAEMADSSKATAIRREGNSREEDQGTSSLLASPLNAQANENAGEECPAIRNLSQQTDLLRDMGETISEIGKRLAFMHSIVADARNIHKPVKAALNEAMALFEILTEKSSAIIETGSVREIVCSTETHTGKKIEDTVPKKKSKHGQRKKKSPREDGQRREPSESRTREIDEPSAHRTSEEDEHLPLESEQEEGWQEVRRKQKKKKKESKNDAIKVAAKEGTSYVDIIKEISAKRKPKEGGADFKMVRKTKKGEYLFVLQEQGKTEEFHHIFKETLEGKADVAVLTKQSTIVVRDVMEFSTEDDVREAIRKEAGIPDLEMACYLRKGYAGLQSAIVKLSQNVAAALLQKKKIAVDMVYCSITVRKEVIRCYRCHAYGHIAKRCSGPDRRKLCWNCGGDHQRKDCTTETACLSCKDSNVNNQHRPGSKLCTSFQNALTKQKKQWS